MAACSRSSRGWPAVSAVVIRSSRAGTTGVRAPMSAPWPMARGSAPSLSVTRPSCQLSAGGGSAVCRRLACPAAEPHTLGEELGLQAVPLGPAHVGDPAELLEDPNE